MTDKTLPKEREQIIRHISDLLTREDLNVTALRKVALGQKTSSLPPTPRCWIGTGKPGTATRATYLNACLRFLKKTAETTKNVGTWVCTLH